MYARIGYGGGKATRSATGRSSVTDPREVVRLAGQPIQIALCHLEQDDVGSVTRDNLAVESPGLRDQHGREVAGGEDGERWRRGGALQQEAARPPWGCVDLAPPPPQGRGGGPPDPPRTAD